MATIELARLHGDFGFEAKDENGHSVRMDSSPESGGENFGVRPMQMLLMGLAGCSGIDVISILKKQRQDVTDYKMVVNGDRETGKEPSLWKDVSIDFHIYGNVDQDKAERAVELSVNKYCSVAATLSGSGTQIKYKVFVHPTA
ncbi:osmotically inducible protein OsmC [Mucilaginibacter sp. PPCGB 2223]|uniref:OsmC family protein n=1 Tax=Mucilaginibacter sp. PPCGB 2223 TaxID=1886027 RepID=UPI000824FB30|nr:OsmC family protein [Mucilaginibacter sp. PPCGB 2223]OCX51366.1 osmotically inducible protein OsmC [Mucilaginibacter sp. PPCGB 2223]